jgi:carbamoyltransferase
VNVLGLSGFPDSVAFKRAAYPDLALRLQQVVQGLDSAAALVDDQGIRAAAAEERFTGQKGTGALPVNALRFCLREAGLRLEDVEVVAHAFAYDQYREQVVHDELTSRQFAEVYARSVLLARLEAMLPGCAWSDKLVQVPHHLAHAASAFYPSGYDRALILVVDGMGEVHSTTVAVGGPNGIEIVRQVAAPHSLGLLYGVVTHYLGFKMSSDEGKVMGLAPYGNPRRHFRAFADLVRLRPDGTYAVPLLLANRSAEEKDTYAGAMRVLEELFGPARRPGDEIMPNHRDVAAGLQAALEASLMHILQHFRAETGQADLCMAGGVALNCTANGLIRRSRLFRRMFVQPAAGDDGSALGAALQVQHQGRSAPRRAMALPLWGPSFDREAVREAVRSRSAACQAREVECFDELAGLTAQRLAEGQVVGWFQGSLEFGPRALGNRSILADPRGASMRERINALIKKREEFRPFAPAVTREAADRFFELEGDETELFRHMLVVAQVRQEHRALLPAVTHVDGSARVQVVFREEHLRFWTLLDRFGSITGLPVLLNTSFNLRDQPIVCQPDQAVDTFLESEIDLLVIGDMIVSRVAEV